MLSSSDHSEPRARHTDDIPRFGAKVSAAILAEAMARYDILDVACVHRIGDLAIGELAVWVGATAAHRDAAFAACRHVIEEVKARVPIWKHERYADGDAAWLHPPKGGSPAD